MAEFSFIHGLSVEIPDGLTLTELLRTSLLNPAHAGLAAVIGPEAGASVSYSKLRSEVERISDTLLGCLPVTTATNPIVVVCLDRSTDLVYACCACIFIGYTYAAIHPADPVLRKAALLQLTAPAAVLTSSHYADSVHAALKHAGVTSKVITVDSIEGDARPGSAGSAAPAQPPLLSSIAYCTFTSGSTGSPKGVLLSQRALLHFLFSLRKFHGSPAPFGPGARLLQVSRVSFDVHFFELIGALFFGGATVLLPPDDSDALASRRLLSSLCLHGVTWAFMVPVVGEQLRKALVENPSVRPDSLRFLCLGGEAASPSLFRDLKRLLSSHVRFFNLYGPAECSIASFLHEVRDSDLDPDNPHAIPIGLPLPGYSCALSSIDKKGPAKVLLIGGPGVMTGYLGKPEESRYALRELSSGDSSTPTTFYDSGDLVRVNDDGNLVYTGRGDNQVKIRGQRIELAEIEAVLKAAVSIGRNCAATTISLSNGSRAIAAYFEEKIDPSRLSRYCHERLPNWMVPAFYEFLPQGIPMSPNGKVDRSRLPRPSVVFDADIAIIGGGVAGMVTAIACMHRGLSFRIFDSAAELGGVWINGAANPLSKLQQPFEYYMIDQDTAVPVDVDGRPNRFPSTSTLLDYIRRVDQKHGISASALFSTRVVSVERVRNDQPSPLAVRFSSTSGQVQSLVFSSVVCATGRFHPSRSILPEWIPPKPRYTVVQAREFAPVHAASRRVAIIGGGPYAIEAIRIAVESGASHVTLVNRAPRWVFPRSWFDDPVRTRLYWRLFGGLSLHPKLVLLTKILLTRRYIAAGLEEMIPKNLPFTNPQTSISEEFFAYGGRKNVSYVRGAVISSSSDSLTIRRGSAEATILPVDTVVVACGFSPPDYPFLNALTPLKMFLGSVLDKEPNVGFVGVGFAEGVFSNPLTCRSQANMLLNMLQFPQCRRSAGEIDKWLSSLAKIDSREQTGSNAALADFLSELRRQTQILARSKSPQSSDVNTLALLSPSSDPSQVLLVVSQIVNSILGEAVPPSVPLLHVGMDSLRSIELRSRLVNQFGSHRVVLPTVSTLLWDLPTVADIAAFCSAQLCELKATSGPSFPAT